MISVEKILKSIRIENKKVKISSLEEFNLNDADFETLIKYLMSKNVELEDDVVETHEESGQTSQTNLNSISLYLKDIGDIPLLSEEEEKSLFISLRNGDSIAKKKLIEANLRLVVLIAKKYSTQKNLLDTIGNGNLGLIKAVETFDVSKGYKFSTYAPWWIRQFIFREAANNSTVIRKPAYILEEIGKIKKAKSNFYIENLREPTITELSNLTGLNENKILELMSVDQVPTSIDASIGEDGDSCLLDFVSEGKDDIGEIVSNRIVFKQIIEVSKKCLTPMEFKIVLLRYGVGQKRRYTLEEIGKEYKLTRERIRQIEAKAFKKVRKQLQIKKLF